MDRSRLDERLDATGHDGYLIDADGTNSDQRYLSGFDAPDAFVTLYTPAGLHLLVSELEFGRATKESRADEVLRHADFDFQALRAEYGTVEARRELIARFVDEAGVSAVAVPPRFPIGTADGLRDRGVPVAVDDDETITEIRAVKTAEELDNVRAAQAANEAALCAAEELIATATPDDGMLVADGEPLTAERVKTEIEIALLRQGYALDETIVAGGERGADPHDRGSGPLPANEPIVIDVFPRDKATGYHADMTRTFVRGEPSEAVRDRFDITVEALDAALGAVEPGATGEDVHDAACDVYEAAGYTTLRSDPDAETGFIHSTGHGVGLDVHEAPRLGPGGGELRPGHVVTVEPGLYDPVHGGMRVEDIVIVTNDGHENLTEYPRSLVV